jgi:hypothetical protein
MAEQGSSTTLEMSGCVGKTVRAKATETEAPLRKDIGEYR